MRFFLLATAPRLPHCTLLATHCPLLASPMPHCPLVSHRRAASCARYGEESGDCHSLGATATMYGDPRKGRGARPTTELGLRVHSRAARRRSVRATPVVCHLCSAGRSAVQPPSRNCRGWAVRHSGQGTRRHACLAFWPGNAELPPSPANRSPSSALQRAPVPGAGMAPIGLSSEPANTPPAG